MHGVVGWVGGVVAGRGRCLASSIRAISILDTPLGHVILAVKGPRPTAMFEGSKKNDPSAGGQSA